MTIIYDSPDMVAVNKPAGIITHPVDATDTQLSIAGWFREHYPASAGVGDEPTIRPGIMHRLDKTTSGVLLLAKTQQAFDALKAQFKNRTISKEYRALVHGIIHENQGTIEKHITRSRRAAFKMRVGDESEGRPAVTMYAVLQRFMQNDDNGEAKDASEGATYLSVFPKTGRTHQIRVHLQAIHHPIIGDQKYGFKRMDHHGLERLFLHAYAVECLSPTGVRLRLEAELPPDLQRVLDSLAAKNV